MDAKDRDNRQPTGLAFPHNQSRGSGVRTLLNQQKGETQHSDIQIPRQHPISDHENEASKQKKRTPFVDEVLDALLAIVPSLPELLLRSSPAVTCVAKCIRAKFAALPPRLIAD